MNRMEFSWVIVGNIKMLQNDFQRCLNTVTPF